MGKNPFKAPKHFSAVDWDWFREQREKKPSKPQYTAEEWAAFALKREKRKRVVRRSKRKIRPNPEGNDD